MYHLMKLLRILVIFFCIVLHFLVAQASFHSLKFVFSTACTIQGRATTQERNAEQQFPRKLLQINQEFVNEKTRLGSTPPSCHNKCNACNPCVAIQVPTSPNHGQVHSPSHGQPFPATTEVSKKYTNYKPVGWKCKCRNHLFNP